MEVQLFAENHSICCGKRDENLFDFMVSSVASRILRLARLDARASVPPLTRPPTPGFLPLGSSSWKSVIEIGCEKLFRMWVAPEAKTCQ
jgi:hypothetical protein